MTMCDLWQQPCHAHFSLLIRGRFSFRRALQTGASRKIKKHELTMVIENVDQRESVYYLPGTRISLGSIS